MNSINGNTMALDFPFQRNTENNALSIRIRGRCDTLFDLQAFPRVCRRFTLQARVGRVMIDVDDKADENFCQFIIG